MPSSSIEALGRLISRQAAGHPDRARALLRTAYTLVGVQMKYFPPKNVLPARCAMQGDTARSMAAALGRPGRAACVNIFLPCEVLHALNIPPVLPEGLSCYLESTAAERVVVEAAEERGDQIAELAKRFKEARSMLDEIAAPADAPPSGENTASPEGV